MNLYQSILINKYFLCSFIYSFFVGIYFHVLIYLSLKSHLARFNYTAFEIRLVIYSGNEFHFGQIKV